MAVPALPDSFYWTEEPWGTALRCRPLEGVAPHLFSTRPLGLSEPFDWDRAAASVGAARTITTIQVHGRAVAAVSGAAEPSSIRPEADALVSNRADLAIAIRTADCVPLLLADAATGAVAAVHAGWRGTAAGIVGAALDAMTLEFGTRPADIIAAIGPSIGACCYEVGSELVDAFAAAGHSRDLVDRWFLTAPSRSGPLHLDLPSANRDQLILAGVPEECVYRSELCTAMHLDILTSYRVEKQLAGRMAAVIRARPTLRVSRTSGGPRRPSPRWRGGPHPC